MTSQQVNLLFGRKVLEESIEEKIGILALTGELMRVIDAFTTTGVQCIPLKGPVLSLRMYGDPTIRNLSDLDILVDENSIDQAISIVESLGYHAESVDWPKRESQQRRLRRYAHHLNYFHLMMGFRIELHWLLISSPAINHRTLGRIVSSNLTRVEFFGRDVVVMTDEMELIYLIIHGGHHQWFWLKWLGDVNQYLKRRNINNVRFLELMASLKAERLVALCNLLLKEYFPGDPVLPFSEPVPAYMVKYSKNRIEGDGISGQWTFKTMVQYLYFFMVAYPGLASKLRSVTHILCHSILYGRINSLFSIRPRSVTNEA